MRKKLKVLANYINDVDRHVVRIPWQHRGGLQRRGWCRVSVPSAGTSVVCQVYGDEDTETREIIRMDRTLRDELSVDRDRAYTFEVRPVGVWRKVFSGWLRHSDVGIQVSTLLGILGFALGLVSIALGVIALVLSWRH